MDVMNRPIMQKSVSNGKQNLSKTTSTGLNNLCTRSLRLDRINKEACDSTGTLGGACRVPSYLMMNPEGSRM